jgi:branched-chain amino acid transport system ATP-binding protein
MPDDGAVSPAATPSVPALELQGITGGYDAGDVVQDVSIVVPQGTAVVLLGPNGAGKTTLLRLACGLLRPRAGRILLDGHDITHASTHERAMRGLCHVPEGRAIFPSLSVKDNILLSARRGAEAHALEAAVAAFPVLGERMSARASTLSGGQQQMLALVPAFVTEPRVVLVDEPSLGLAPVLVDAIFEFLGRLSARGVAMLLVEQYVRRALAVSSSAYVLQRGRVQLEGPSSELQSSSLMASYFGRAEA